MRFQASVLSRLIQGKRREEEVQRPVALVTIKQRPHKCCCTPDGQRKPKLSRHFSAQSSFSNPVQLRISFVHSFKDGASMLFLQIAIVLLGQDARGCAIDGNTNSPGLRQLVIGTSQFQPPSRAYQGGQRSARFSVLLIEGFNANYGKLPF
ncbi:hypothetical protein DNTS_034617 [Danionella cerebrum]|uniref:Uncharacterized protein n=1 Tax=Danionella cerebrum TaxID=2873325 RepID=A0A553N044_9TELE|nr:hypothetical protein DNTS_034617 [Danionella translucida]